MLRLPRWQPKNGRLAIRMPSPVTGSTLITSAPRSPMIIGPNGPGEVLAEVDEAHPFERVHQRHSRRELRDVGGRVAELAEDLGVVLTGRRPRPLDRAGRAGEVDRHADLRGVAELRVVDRRDHVVRRRAAGAARRRRRARTPSTRSPRSRGCSRGTPR